MVGVCSPAGACIRHGRSGHSSDATPSDMYFGFVPCLSPFLLISLSIVLPHDLYISYSFAPYEELGIRLSERIDVALDCGRLLPN